MILIILPNQLFNKKIIKNIIKVESINKIILLIHPDFFEKYNFNKKKLILHYATMFYYKDYLSDLNIPIEFANKINIETYCIFDPINKIKFKGNVKMIESPNFLLTKNDYQEYFNSKKNEKHLFNNFYMWGKKKLGIIPDVKSTDKLNRTEFSDKIPIPIDNKSFTKQTKYINKAITFVNKYYKNNHGNTDNFIFPISHKEANDQLSKFCINKLKHFGDYQDIVYENNNLYHSMISSSLNIGLINPNDVVEEIMKYKNKYSINNIEGFIRQLFWREYQRYCYIHINYDKYINNPYFKLKSNLTKEWYTGNTNNTIIDNTIKKAFDTSYLHHIERLMIIGNYMMLSYIKPKDAFKWFMEFSIDSYEWVMHQNVYDMILFITGGLTTRKPYISTSNYIIKMSNYKCKNIKTSCEEWNNKYKHFLKNNKKKLYKFRYFFKLS
jgi:deoxyribodipyrimidine photolyase-related protein